jgi:hypothetical protein
VNTVMNNSVSIKKGKLIYCQLFKEYPALWSEVHVLTFSDASLFQVTCGKYWACARYE